MKNILCIVFVNVCSYPKKSSKFWVLFTWYKPVSSIPPISKTLRRNKRQIVKYYLEKWMVLKLREFDLIMKKALKKNLANFGFRGRSCILGRTLIESKSPWSLFKLVEAVKIWSDINNQTPKKTHKTFLKVCLGHGFCRMPKNQLAKALETNGNKLIAGSRG